MTANSFDTPKTPRKFKWIWWVVIQSSLVLITASTNAYAINTKYNIEKENYKLYSHIKLTNSRQYLCLEQLWDQESQWNPKSKNKKSSAYGIPQLLHLKITNPYLQIDAGLAYITKRYGSPCKAWAYHLKHGHY